MKWQARKLINTDSWFDFWDKSDPYLKFLKIIRYPKTPNSTKKRKNNVGAPLIIRSGFSYILEIFSAIEDVSNILPITI